MKSAYIAPLYLLTGQLAHFDDNWRRVVEAYANVTSVDDPIADETLRHLRAFQFACWIVWGPSIPVCTCEYWDHEHKNAVAFQLGYGDENTSVVLYDESGALRHAARRARRRAAGPKGAGRAAPLAVELEATVVVRRPGSADPKRVCQAQTELLDVGAERVVLQHRRLDATGRAGRRYYSAYLWVMFVLEAGPGRPLMRRGEPWRALLPFFVHGNIADAATYALLKDRLAHEALDSIATVLRQPGVPPDVRFVYMSAIDDPGCGGPALGKRPGCADQGHDAAAARRSLCRHRRAVWIRDDSAEMKAEDGVGTTPSSSRPATSPRPSGRISSASSTSRASDRMAPERPEVRELGAGAADLELLEAFYAGLYTGAFPDPDERESLANIRRYLELKARGWYGANNYHVRVLVDGGRVAAGSVSDYLAGPNAGVIEFLVVAPDSRSRGLGRTMLHDAESGADRRCPRGRVERAWRRGGRDERSVPRIARG